MGIAQRRVCVPSPASLAVQLPPPVPVLLRRKEFTAVLSSFRPYVFVRFPQKALLLAPLHFQRQRNVSKCVSLTWFTPPSSARRKIGPSRSPGTTGCCPRRRAHLSPWALAGNSFLFPPHLELLVSPFSTERFGLYVHNFLWFAAMEVLEKFPKWPPKKGPMCIGTLFNLMVNFKPAFFIT